MYIKKYLKKNMMRSEAWGGGEAKDQVYIQRMTWMKNVERLGWEIGEQFRWSIVGWW